MIRAVIPAPSLPRLNSRAKSGVFASEPKGKMDAGFHRHDGQ